MQFKKKSSQPMRPESYRAAARKLRRIADQLDAKCHPASPREQAALTRCIHGLSIWSQSFSQRHRKAINE